MFVYGWGILLAIITILYLLVCVDGNKKGILSKIKNLCLVKLPDFIKSVMRSLCGEWFVQQIERLITYVFYK
jgi:hypothetical protein